MCVCVYVIYNNSENLDIESPVLVCGRGYVFREYQVKFVGYYVGHQVKVKGHSTQKSHIPHSCT